jgi:hypothetical protein
MKKIISLILSLVIMNFSMNLAKANSFNDDTHKWESITLPYEIKSPIKETAPLHKMIKGRNGNLFIVQASNNQNRRTSLDLFMYDNTMKIWKYQRICVLPGTMNASDVNKIKITSNKINNQNELGIVFEKGAFADFIQIMLPAANYNNDSIFYPTDVTICSHIICFMCTPKDFYISYNTIKKRYEIAFVRPYLDHLSFSIVYSNYKKIKKQWTCETDNIPVDAGFELNITNYSIISDKSGLYHLVVQCKETENSRPLALINETNSGWNWLDHKFIHNDQESSITASQTPMGCEFYFNIMRAGEYHTLRLLDDGSEAISSQKSFPEKMQGSIYYMNDFILLQGCEYDNKMNILLDGPNSLYFYNSAKENPFISEISPIENSNVDIAIEENTAFISYITKEGDNYCLKVVSREANSYLPFSAKKQWTLCNTLNNIHTL